MIMAKKTNLNHVVLFFFTLMLLIARPPHIAFADGDTISTPVIDTSNLNLEDELAWLREENYVTIATKTSLTVSDAPSVVTVITSEEIANLGITKLHDILRIIPGFDVSKDATFGLELFGVRGLSNASKQTRVLLDGHSLNIPTSGNSVWFFDDLPLKNVEKIEVIRGPGSALYGANAFLAVINIITKNAEDIDGIEVSSGFGSFDTQDYSILFGKQFKEIDVVGFANFYNSNGLSDTIKEDSISGLRSLGSFSIAPGDTDDGRNKLDLNLKLSYKDLEFRAKYLNKDTEPFVSAGYVLTNESENYLNFVMGDLRYKFDIGERITIKPRIYYDQYDRDLLGETLPDGTEIPFDLDGDGDFELFLDGKFARAFLTNRILGAEIQVEYELFDSNSLTVGFDYEWERQDNVRFHSNADPLTGASLGSFQNVTETPFAREVVRQIWALYFQDRWDITDNLGFTFGVRHDHYSDFEGTTNPRIGFVWDFIDNATLKLLYGQAFRAPDFGELYTVNNTSFLGNPDLQPETIRTYEVALAYRFTDTLNANVNYFFNVMRDRILFLPKARSRDPFVFANTGGANVQGVEFEARKDFGKGNYAFANYTYLDAEAKGDPMPNVPKHKGNIGVNFGLTKYLNANIHAFISDQRVRDESDERDDNSSYALLNLSLTVKEFFNDMKIKASLFNLLDKNYTDPSPVNTLPHDIPRPGRTFFIELNYEW